MASLGFYKLALRVIKPTRGRSSTAGMVTVTELVAVNESKGLHLTSDMGFNGGYT